MGLESQADPKHVEEIAKGMGLKAEWGCGYRGQCWILTLNKKGLS